MKTISFKANVVLKYDSNSEGVVSWDTIKMIFESDKIQLENFSVNYFGDNFEPTIIIKEKV